MLGAVGPEISLSVALAGALAIGDELGHEGYGSGIDDSFRAEASCFREPGIVFCEAEEIDARTFCAGGEEGAEVCDVVGDFGAIGVYACGLRCVCVIGERESGGGTERREPVGVFALQAQWAGEDALFVFAEVLDASAEMRDAADAVVVCA
jgi:hypothetical protein